MSEDHDLNEALRFLGLSGDQMTRTAGLLKQLGYRRVGPGECVVRRELVDDAINAIDEGRGHLGDYLFEKYKHPEIIVELSLAAATPSESETND